MALLTRASWSGRAARRSSRANQLAQHHLHLELGEAGAEAAAHAAAEGIQV